MKHWSIILSLAVISGACKKDDNKESGDYKCTTCITLPEAKEQHNNSSAGVYKGVMVGSTGTIALYLYNTGTEVKALATFDGKNATLTTTDLANWTPGQAISNARFKGTINNQEMNAVFSVGANGQNPSVQVTIPGHTVVVAIYKETSSSLIKNFEGTYQGDASGIFNITFNGSSYTLVRDGGVAPANATLINGNVELTSNGILIKGSFNGTDVIEGTWKEISTGTHGTWKGNRTL